VGAAKNIDYLTPMQPRFASEVAHGAAGVTRSEANEMVEKLLAKYEDQLGQAPKGVKFQDCYDWGSIEPHDEYVDLYARMKEEMRGYGLRFK
jgi:methylamine--corrinoid protein Co-methyltransferase